MRYLFYKIRYRLTKQIIKFVMSFFMIFFVLFTSTFSFYRVETSANVVTGAMQIVGYIGSVLGIVDKGTGGGVTGLGAQMTSHIQNWYAENFDNGEIYKNANGEICFSGTATSNLYNALGDNLNARIVSSGFHSRMFLSDYTSILINTEISTWLADNPQITDFMIFGCECTRSNGSSTLSKLCAYDMREVAYMVFKNNELYFYNNAGENISVYSCASSQTVANGDLSKVNSSTSRTNYIYINNSYYDRDILSTKYCYMTPHPVDPYSNFNDFLNLNFPCYDSFNGFYCNKSVIIGNSQRDCLNKFLGDTYNSTLINNYYTQIPSVKEETLINNDWDSVYNSYVTNVNNESNTYYNQTTGDYDYDKLRKSMKKYQDNILNAIESGAEDIAEQVNYLNVWCERIYEVECEIRDLIQSNESGGGSAADLTNIEDTLNDLLGYIQGTSGDIATIKGDVVTLNGNVVDISSDLATIINYLNTFNGTLAGIDNKVDYLEDSYTILSEILQYMLQHPWGSSGGGSPFVSPTDNPWSDWFNYIRDNDNFPYESIISKFDILKNLLMASAPFCFLTFASAFVNSLVVEPVEPTFTIPVRMNNSLVNVDEEMELDLTIFDSILPITDSLLCILFTICLLWSSIYIISHLLNIFQLK